MADFFFQYGLFAAKSLTLIFGILAALVILIVLLVSRKNRDGIEIEKLNDKFDELKETLEAEILPKEIYKRNQKEKKKKEKLEKKQAKRQKDEIEVENKGHVYVIRFDGDLHASEVENLRECITAVLTVAQPKDEVVVILDSSGGIVHNYGLAASQLKRIKDKKLYLTVAVDLVAASGGYMMACVADQIIAAPFAVLGSIGVLAQVPNFYRFLNKNNIDIEHHTAGEYKTTLTMLSKTTEQAREKFKEELEDTHQLFKAFVKDHRGQIAIDEIATGEHWYATQCLEKNLVDKIQTSDDYLLEKAEEYDLFEVTYRVHETFKEKIESMVYKTSKKILQHMLAVFSKPIKM